MFMPSLNSTRLTMVTRLAVALTLAGGVSLVQPAFAGKPFFERKKPHVSVGAVRPRLSSRSIPIDPVIHIEFDHVNRGQALRQPRRLQPNHFLGLDHSLVNKQAWHAPSSDFANGPDVSTEAQRRVAEANARATIQAAKQAADVQEWTGSQVGRRRLANVAGSDRFNFRQRNGLFERRAAPASRTDNDAYYRATMAQPDAIDLYYGREGSWGTGEGAAPYSYSE